jgi:hypothetical protein
VVDAAHDGGPHACEVHVVALLVAAHVALVGHERGRRRGRIARDDEGPDLGEVHIRDLAVAADVAALAGVPDLVGPRRAHSSAVPPGRVVDARAVVFGVGYAVAIRIGQGLRMHGDAQRPAHVRERAHAHAVRVVDGDHPAFRVGDVEAARFERDAGRCPEGTDASDDLGVGRGRDAGSTRQEEGCADQQRGQSRTQCHRPSGSSQISPVPGAKCKMPAHHDRLISRVVRAAKRALDGA